MFTSAIGTRRSVVNDGSTDGTAAIVEQFAQLNPQVRVLNNPQNRGKGYSVRQGCPRWEKG